MTDQWDTPDTSEPRPERQDELRTAYAENVAKGNPPYAGVWIRTVGELNWIKQKWWYVDNSPEHSKPLNLSRAILVNSNLANAVMLDADLSYAELRCANLSGAGLVGATLTGAGLMGVNFTGANLEGARLDRALLSEADLPSANLRRTNLSKASLRGANLTGAVLENANLSGTTLTQARLCGANLRAVHMDAETDLTDAVFDTRTQVADVRWNGTALARLNWEHLNILGDESIARYWKDETPTSAFRQHLISNSRLRAYQDAARANRLVAVALRSQGLVEYADRFAYQAQLCQRQVLRRQGVSMWLSYFGSLLLWAISGYGYRLWRILAAYTVALVFFALVYWRLGIHSFRGESGIQSLWDSLLVSLSAIHGRTTFEQLGAWSSTAWVAGVESVVGIVIEGVFVAMLIQRWFQR